MKNLFQKGHKPWNTGKKRSPEFCKKMSEIMKGKVKPNSGSFKI